VLGLWCGFAVPVVCATRARAALRCCVLLLFVACCGTWCRTSPNPNQTPNTHTQQQRTQQQQLQLSGLGHEDAVLAEFKRTLTERGVVVPHEMVVNGDEDATLRRFLRARKWRVEAAFAMLESARQQWFWGWVGIEGREGFVRDSSEKSREGVVLRQFKDHAH
jgi:hypothetical protein